MKKPNSDKKNAVLILSVFAVIIASMLLLIPFEKRNRLYEKWGALAELAESDERARFIIENEELYPEEILDTFYRQSDSLDYVYNYPFYKDSYKTMSFTEEELNSDTVPALYMNDYRWAYEDGGYVSSYGCAAVSITMANLYVNRNSDVDPIKVMRYADERGYYGFGGIDEAGINDILDNFGIIYNEYICSEGGALTESELKALLDKKNTAIMGAMQGSTFKGHAIIIRGYDENGFYINDPVSKDKTAQVWDFHIIMDDASRYWAIYSE